MAPMKSMKAAAKKAKAMKAKAMKAASKVIGKFAQNSNKKPKAFNSELAAELGVSTYGIRYTGWSKKIFI